MTRSGLLAQAPRVPVRYEQVTVSSVFSAGVAPVLGTLCGSAYGSRSARDFSSSRSSCHNPSVAGNEPVAATLGRSVHPSFSLPGSDRHNGSPAQYDKPVVHSVQIPQLRTQPTHVVPLLREFFSMMSFSTSCSRLKFAYICFKRRFSSSSSSSVSLH
jgi:hypothetical protein